MRTTFPSSTQCCYGLKFMCDAKQHEKIRWGEMTIFHFSHMTGNTVKPCKEALLAGGGGPMSPVLILKPLVLVFINTFCLLSALPSLSQFGQGRLSLVVISFYALSLLFEPCRLSEFTLAGPLLIQTLRGPQKVSILMGCPY